MPLSKQNSFADFHLASFIVHVFTELNHCLVFLLGLSFLSIGLAVALSVWAMMVTKTIHPPAGANPIIAILGAKSITFILLPVAIGASIIIIFAIIYIALQWSARDTEFTRFAQGITNPLSIESPMKISDAKANSTTVDWRPSPDVIAQLGSSPEAKATANQVDLYQREGVILIRGLFSDWVDQLRAGLQRNMDDSRWLCISLWQRCAWEWRKIFRQLL